MTPPSFLKLLLQSVLLISTRANLFTQISDIAINSVYQSNSTEFYLNLEPFLKVHVKWLNDKSTVVKGSHGNGHDGSVNFAYLMERIDKTENKKSRNKARKNASSSILGYKLSGATQGNFRAHWLSSVGFIPKKLQDTSFENKARFIITLQGFFVQFAGKLGNQKYLQQLKAQIKSFSFEGEGKKYKFGLKVQPKVKISDKIHEFWKSCMAPIGDGVLNVTFTAPMTCFDGSGSSKTKATEIFETENVISENEASEITVSENEVSQHGVSEDANSKNAIPEKLNAKQSTSYAYSASANPVTNKTISFANTHSKFPFLHPSCYADILVDGLYKNENISRINGYYRTKSNTAKITFKEASTERFQFILQGLEKMELLQLKYRINQTGMVTFVKYIGASNSEKLKKEVNKFSAPFRGLVDKRLVISSRYSDIDFTLHYLCYCDTIFKFIQGKSYFDIYPIIKASEFESDILARKLGVKSVQSLMKIVGEQVNLETETVLKEYGEWVAGTRTYLQRIVGVEGKQQFLEWFEGAKSSFEGATEVIKIL